MANDLNIKAQWAKLGEKKKKKKQLSEELAHIIIVTFNGPLKGL